MATRTLKRREAINVISRKTAFNKQQVESLMITLKPTGKISFPYFKEIVEILRQQCGRLSFSLNNEAEWEYVKRRLQEEDIPAIKFAEYFCSDPIAAAEIRAQVMKPKTSPVQVKQFMADCLNKDAALLNEEAPFSMLTAAALPHDYNFYLTLSYWCNAQFRKSPPKELIEKGSLRELLEFYSSD